MNTVLVRYGYYVRTKRYEKKKTNAKHAVKAEISMKTKSLSSSYHEYMHLTHHTVSISY